MGCRIASIKEIRKTFPLKIDTVWRHSPTHWKVYDESFRVSRLIPNRWVKGITKDFRSHGGFFRLVWFSRF